MTAGSDPRGRCAVYLRNGSNSESCLASRLSRYIDLTEAELRFVARMERDSRPLKRRQAIYEIGELTEELHVVKYGWALVYGAPVRGRRPILHIYLPGDVMGMAEIAQTHAVHATVMRTDGMICPFPRAAIADMYAQVPRLGALIMALNSLEHLGLRQRFAAATSLNAEAALIQFLLALKNRLDAAQTQETARFYMPLTQSELGDHLGLTSIYINRLLRRLNDRGVLTLRDKHVQIHDPDAVSETAGLRNDWTNIDQSWFPA
ncbi:Crp/Fnr family transcriptional regulator [Dinoroseobacter sp. S375]|uniref:Crp/Fnr family transcriptional regulator n=1 Tax=Dinoroseobacter sp. S375 TaxID=3415136 RepID=UPI003C7B1807